MSKPAIPAVYSDARPSRAAHPEEGIELRSLVQSFIRGFGLLSTNRTPFGQRLSISHAHALLVLLDCSRKRTSPTQQQLGRVLGIDKSNVARLCRRMENAGHVRQKQCADDGRARLLSITDKGVRMAVQLEEASQQHFTAVMSAIAPHARAGVLSAIDALNSAIRQVAKGKSNHEADDDRAGDERRSVLMTPDRQDDNGSGL